METSKIDHWIESIRNFVSTEYNNGQYVDNNMLLLSSNLIDSMGTWRLISFISDLLEFEIPSDDLIVENFDSIENIRTLLLTYRV